MYLAQRKTVVEANCKSEIKSVRIKQDRCIVVIELQIFIFNLADFRILEVFDTCLNPKGLCSMSYLKEPTLMAYPSKKIGFIELYNEKMQETKTIEGHKSLLGSLELCPNGHKLATAS